MDRQAQFAEKLARLAQIELQKKLEAEKGIDIVAYCMHMFVSIYVCMLSCMLINSFH